MEMLEKKWGKFVPTNLDGGADADVERKKFHACLFINNLWKPKYSYIIDDYNNNYLDGNVDAYPDTVEAAVTKITHRMKTDPKPKKKGKQPGGDGGDDERPRPRAEKSFSQTSKGKKKYCKTCGGTGHLASRCPNDDDSDVSPYASSSNFETDDSDNEPSVCSVWDDPPRRRRRSRK